MVNYPTRCICFFVVAIVFFLIPSVGLIYFYNLPLIETHSQFNESICTTFPQSSCGLKSEDYLCVSFPLANGFHSSGELLPLRRDRPLKEHSEVTCFFDPLTISENLYCQLNASHFCCNETRCVETQPVANNSHILMPPVPGCVFIDLTDPNTPIPLLNVTEVSNITSYGAVCYSTNQTILERLDYGGLSILLEGFFLTFAAILFIGVGLSTFVEKTENNDAYCFSIKL